MNNRQKFNINNLNKMRLFLIRQAGKNPMVRVLYKNKTKCEIPLPASYQRLDQEAISIAAKAYVYDWLDRKADQ